MSEHPVIELEEPAIVVPNAKDLPRSSESLSPNTTEQQDKTLAGQRRINIIWEVTQATIAVLVVMSNMIVAVWNGVRLDISPHDHPTVLSSALFLIVGFYFARTNHASIGGVGSKANTTQIYEGR
jgi:hypothetical protein